MGNRRKILTAIFGVMLLAAGAVSGAFLAFKPNALNDVPTTNAVTVANGGTQTIDGTGRNAGTSAAFTVTSGRKYYVEMAGQKGQDAVDTANVSGNNVITGSGGNGGIVYGFLNATTTTYTGTIGQGGGKGYYTDGGGYTMFPAINFAIPTTTLGGSTSGQPGYAGGGGGGAYVSIYGDTTNLSGTCNAHYDKGDSGAYGTSSATTIRVKHSSSSNYTVILGAGHASQTAPGSSITFTPPSSSLVTYGANGSGSNGGAGGAGGGGGYYGGGGSIYATGNNALGYATSGGGGGSCSPNTYWIGATSTGYGYIKVVDITPTQNPSVTRALPGAVFTVTAGTANNPGMCQWQYSLNNSTWQTSNSLTAQTTVGTQKVYWRYVITADTTLNRPLTVISSGSVDLQVGDAPGTVAAPTLTGNGSATYTGNAIKVVTAAGKSSGTFTFATKETDENDESEREEY